jgi:uncharacterized membrane protein YebE (DUF533 family)
MKIFPFAVQMSWGLGLVLAALILGNKSTNAPAWAAGTLGVVVLLGAFCAQIVDEHREQSTVAERAASGPL